MILNNGDGVIFLVNIITLFIFVVIVLVFIMVLYRVWFFYMVDNWDRRVFE